MDDTFFYYAGGAALFFFIVQVVTGALLLMYYRPSAGEAFESVQFIMARVPFGCAGATRPLARRGARRSGAGSCP